MNNIRQWMLAAILTLCSTTIIAQNGVTFTVDENITFDKGEDFMAHLQFSGEDAVEDVFQDEGMPGDTYKWLAWSFADNEKFHIIRGKDVFFKTVVRAYADHRPLVLSPDMIWVLISQGFARYVNAHAEELRDQFVDHDGKIHLVVKSEKELLTEKADWAQIMSDFTGQIESNTKGDIGQTITADFSTTGVTERITSQITLMESLKEYFEYVVVYMACGIPSVTLTGTPKDWQKVLEKTRRLEKYGVGKWTQSLEPILKEFVEASKGKANQKFWQGMVKQKRVDKLAGGGCDPSEPTELDGWILKFFPDEKGQTLDKIPHTDTMPAERVYVDFIYQVINPLTGTIMLEMPMQLVAGFIGTEVNTETHALTPKMGWAVRQMASVDSIVKKLKDLDKDSFSGINLRVSSVPDYLSELKHIKRLTLHFTNGVVLPDWFYKLKIDELRIEGEMSKELEAKIRKHFPRVVLVNPKRSKTDGLLIIVDEEVFDGKLSDIDPATIKKQRVLKDAVGTAVYGSQGENGVIEITTKRE